MAKAFAAIALLLFGCTATPEEQCSQLPDDRYDWCMASFNSVPGYDENHEICADEAKMAYIQTAPHSGWVWALRAKKLTYRQCMRSLRAKEGNH